MDYGPAPEGNEHVQAWLERTRPCGHYIDGKFTDPLRASSFEVRNPATTRCSRTLPKARPGRRPRRGRGARPSRAGRNFRATSARNICTRSPACSEARPLPRRAGDAWTTASRSARRATSTCRWSLATSTTMPAGPSWSRRSSPTTAGGRLRPDHPVELPAADAGVEDRAGARHRQHGGAEAGRADAAHRARLRRNLP